MGGPDSKELFSVIESHIFLVALCLFLLIGAAKLILEELIALVVLWYKLVATIRDKRMFKAGESRSLPPSQEPAKTHSSS